MEILVLCQNLSGSVAFSAGLIEGVPVPARIYPIADGKLTLSGYADSILQHDLEELLQMPNGLYRLPTPAEQEQFARAREAARQLQESVEQTSEDQKSDAAVPPAGEHVLAGKKKASGG